MINLTLSEIAKATQGKLLGADMKNAGHLRPGFSAVG